MKPVEIEILMKDGLTPGLESAGRSVHDMSQRAKTELEEVSESLRLQREYVAGLEKEARKLEAAWRSATPGKERSAAGDRLLALTSELKDEKGALEQLIERERELGEAAGAAHDRAAGAAAGHSSVLVRLLGGQEKYNEIVSRMPTSLQHAAGEISGMTGAARAFIATPLGAVLAAIMLALKAVSTWMHSSADGEMELAKVSGYLGGILDQLKEIVITVGEAIYRAFTDPKQAVTDLWEHIKTNFINRIQGLGEVLMDFGKGAWAAISGDFGSAGESFGRMGDDVLKVLTGVDGLSGKTREYISGLNDLAAKNAEIAMAERQLHIDRREWSIERERMEGRISELRLKAQRGDSAASREAQRLIRERFETEMEHQRRELELIRQKNALTTNSEADYDAEAEAQRKLIALEKERNSELSFFNRKDYSLGNRIDTEEERQRNARVKLGLELAELQRRNDDAEIEAMNEGTDKRLRQIENDYAKRRNEIARQEASWRKDNRTAGGDGELSAEQRSALDEASARNDEARDRAVREAYEAEYALMRDYLKEYGTFQERKLAIAEEYDAKIAKAGSEWERKRLEREKERDIRHVETEAVMQSVDWGSVFGDFSTMFRDQLEPTIEKLKAIAASGEFKGASLEDKKTLYDLIARLEQAATGWDSGIFRTLGDDLTAYQSAMRSYIAAQNDERDATLALAEAKRRLAEAERNKDSNAIVSAKADVAAATEALGNASGAVREFGDKVQEGSGKLQESVRKAEGMFGSLAGSLQGLTSGTLKGVGDALMGIDRLFNNSAVTNAVGGALAKGLNRLLGNSDIGKSVTQALGNSGLMGSMISAVLSILDVLKDGAGVLVSSLIDTVLGGVSGLIEHALDGSMFTQIGGSLLNGVKGILDSVTFGAVSSLFSSSNAAEVQGTIDRLTERNEKLQGAIEDLTDEIKDSKGTKSVAAYRQAYDMQKEVNANYLGMAIAQMGYSNKSHSWAHYWTERGGFTAAEKKWIRENVKSDLGNDIWSINSLSPEEMKKLRGNVGLWDSIWNTGKRGYGWEVAKKMDAYIDQAGKLEDLTSQLYEGLTGMTFDGMYSSFVDSLMDMKYDAQDAADDISEYFMKSMLSNKIGEIYSDRLKDWWSRFGESMEDGTLSEAERNSLQKEYMGYVEEAIKLRDSLAETIGYDPDKGGSGGSGQSGRAGVYTAMTQDQGTRLEGIGTSIQMHEASIDGNVEDVSQKMGTALDHLSRIEENTRDTAGGVRELNEKLDRIIRDGIRI